jgi:hypothetical protein
MNSEFDVYSATIDYLRDERWNVICASPPGGTDLRFKKCLLPRRTREMPERGLRDELDVTAWRRQTILLIECKVRMTHSLRTLNALGESDDVKLRRIVATHSPEELSRLLRRGSGQDSIPIAKFVLPVLAVGILDCAAPPDMYTILTDGEGVVSSFAESLE